jgi:hypothetical protein
MKKAIITNTTAGFEVIFGMERNGEFFPMHYEGSRHYKTLAGAKRAKARWEK